MDVVSTHYWRGEGCDKALVLQRFAEQGEPRLNARQDEVLRFAVDFRVPFDNYAEVRVMPVSV